MSAEFEELMKARDNPSEEAQSRSECWWDNCNSVILKDNRPFHFNLWTRSTIHSAITGMVNNCYCHIISLFRMCLQTMFVNTSRKMFKCTSHITVLLIVEHHFAFMNVTPKVQKKMCFLPNMWNLVVSLFSFSYVMSTSSFNICL